MRRRAFNQIGNEVIPTKPATIKKVSVTMVSWACQAGGWSTGDCVTTGTPTFPTTITLTIYKHSHSDTSTGVVTPGPVIAPVSKSFGIRFRPSSDPGCPLEGGLPTMFRGSDGQCHHGLDQNIVFGLTKSVPKDFVWGVSYNSDNSGPDPIGGSGAPQDSLNVGLAPKTTTGLNRYQDSIFWDTRILANTCGDPTNGNSAPFTTGAFNKDGPCDGTPNSWAGFIPAAAFKTS